MVRIKIHGAPAKSLQILNFHLQYSYPHLQNFGTKSHARPTLQRNKIGSAESNQAVMEELRQKLKHKTKFS